MEAGTLTRSELDLALLDPAEGLGDLAGLIHVLHVVCHVAPSVSTYPTLTRLTLCVVCVEKANIDLLISAWICMTMETGIL